MSHIQDRLKSISKAFQKFDTKEASFSGSESGSASEAGSQASESIASSMSRASDGSQASNGSRVSAKHAQSPDNHHPLESQSVPVQPQVQIQNKPPKTKSSKLVWIVLIVIVLLVIFGLVLYHLYKKRKQNGSSTKKGQNKKQVRFGPSSINEPAKDDPWEQIDHVSAKVNPPRPAIRLPAPSDTTTDEEHQDQNQDLVPI